MERIFHKFSKIMFRSMATSSLQLTIAKQIVNFETESRLKVNYISVIWLDCSSIRDFQMTECSFVQENFFR